MRRIKIFRNNCPAMTLLELLIAVSLLAVVILAVSNLDLFSRHHLLGIDRRSSLQNELSYCLEHMSKRITTAIGNRRAVGAGTQDPIRFNNILGNRAFQVFIDFNATATADGRGAPGSGTQNDRWVAYRFDNNNAVHFYANCGNAANPVCVGVNPVIARRIQAPAVGQINATDAAVPVNRVNIRLTAIWDTAVPVSINNPNVTMATSVVMPSVSMN